MTEVKREISIARIEQLTQRIDEIERERRKLVYQRSILRRALARTGRTLPQEVRAKIAAAHIGIKPTAAARKKMSQSQRKRFEDPEERMKNRAIAIAREHRKRSFREQVDPIESLIFGGR